MYVALPQPQWRCPEQEMEGCCATSFATLDFGCARARCDARCGKRSAGSDFQPNMGYQLNRYEPTAAGEWSFAVEHPWFSSTRYFAAGLSLNYAHKPLVLGYKDSTGFTETQSLVSHQLIGHLDLAGSFSGPCACDDVAAGGDAQPRHPDRQKIRTKGFSVGDPRIGALARIYGQPNQNTWSVSAGLICGFRCAAFPTRCRRS